MRKLKTDTRFWVKPMPLQVIATLIIWLNLMISMAYQPASMYRTQQS